MLVQTDDRDEISRLAREAARVVLAKHPYVVPGTPPPERDRPTGRADPTGVRNVVRALRGDTASG